MKSKIARTTALLAGAGLMFSAGALFAIDGSATKQPPSTQLPPITDQEITAPEVFLDSVNNINLAKIEMGRLARERAQSKSVRKLAERMVSDLTVLENKTKTVAGTLGFIMPTQVDAGRQAAIDKLATFSGAAFDRRYLEDQIAGHRKAISLFQQVAAENLNRSVREFALNTIPLLRQHLKLAEAASKDLKETPGAPAGQ